VVKPMWRSKKSDLIPGLAAFFACLVLPLEMGILVGIGINVVFILYHASRPKIHMEKMMTPSKGIKYLLLTPDRCLIFPSVDYVRNLINKQGLKSQVPVVIDCTVSTLKYLNFDRYFILLFSIDTAHLWS
jgi:sodium-independent sulfate anion transporter 11